MVTDRADLSTTARAFLHARHPNNKINKRVGRGSNQMITPVIYGLFAVSSGLLRVRWGQGMYAGLGLVRVGRGSLAAVR
jgi:hypothetical protein